MKVDKILSNKTEKMIENIINEIEFEINKNKPSLRRNNLHFFDGAHREVSKSIIEHEIAIREEGLARLKLMSKDFDLLTTREMKKKPFEEFIETDLSYKDYKLI